MNPNNSEIDRKMKNFEQLLERSKYNMKQYQYAGVKWCLENEMSANKIKGGIIADEMGLGKTLTIIGLLFVNFKRHTLIVVPPVLLEQWSNEIYKCSGHKVLKYHGKDTKMITEEMLRNAPIVLTTYNMLLPSKKKENILTNITWSRVVYDEAHHLRNRKTTRFKSCKKIKGHIIWLISGTPVQNRRSDFYSLCSIIGLEDVKDNILETVQKYVLRRTKADVGINLPPLILEQWMVPWKTKEEKLMSEELHSLLPNQTGITKMSDGDLAEQFESRGLLIAMLKARQSCILPSLLKKELKHTEYKDVIKTSSKLDAVIELMLIRKDNGNGKIVFCHFSNEINMIAKRLRSVGYKKVAIYDGRNSNTKDGQRVLTEAADVLILQIQTGCEGLNLQENYSEIYFVSPHWNPCVEDQAVARCHRIGQMKPTYVFKFEMCGFENEEDKDAQTLERYVNQVQLRKRTIINEIVSSAYE